MILTEEKAAFAAEHHGVIMQYLKERGLSPDEYYDTERKLKNVCLSVFKCQQRLLLMHRRKCPSGN